MGPAYSKVCNVEDFAAPDLLSVMREVFPHDVARFPGFPLEREHRKHWEVAMAVRALRDGHALGPHAELLGIGAGSEPTIFWLTNHVRRVFATDLYAIPDVWQAEAHPTMLVNPGRQWPSSWEPRRLVVQHMDALSLDYEDDSFEGIFSASSLEHFGTLDDIARAVAEACRVLKPGGTFSLSTEFLLKGDPLAVPGVVMFTEELLREVVLAGHEWDLVGDLDTTVSEATRATRVEMLHVVEDYEAHRAAHGGETYFHELELGQYPHVVIHLDGNEFTSIHLALRKRASGSPQRRPSATLPFPALGPRPEVQALASHLTEPLVLIDAGCRWGFSPEWLLLAERGAHVIGFEADVGEADRLARQYADLPSAEVLGLALGATSGTMTLRHPEFEGGQSLHPNDENWSNRLELGSDVQAVRSMACPVTTLDEWCLSRQITRVDALKLDVQGHELEILKGVEEMLRTVRLIECEVCLNPLFSGTPLFGEVDAWLRERGFVLWRLRDLAHYPVKGAHALVGTYEHAYYAPGEASSYVSGPGILSWANAHYVALDWLDADESSAEVRVRDALVANAARFHDLALLALRKSLAGDVSDVLARDIAVALQMSEVRSSVDPEPEQLAPTTSVPEELLPPIGSTTPSRRENVRNAGRKLRRAFGLTHLRRAARRHRQRSREADTSEDASCPGCR